MENPRIAGNFFIRQSIFLWPEVEIQFSRANPHGHAACEGHGVQTQAEDQVEPIQKFRLGKSKLRAAKHPLNDGIILLMTAPVQASFQSSSSHCADKLYRRMGIFHLWFVFAFPHMKNALEQQGM